jgi:4-amino-4-deoxy-L-arabinose transferase-like glycosyltransferase
MAKKNTKLVAANNHPKVKILEVGGGFVMFAASILIPIWITIAIPFAIIFGWIGILLMLSVLSKESLWKSFIIPSVITILCAASMFIWHLYYKESKQLNFAVPAELTSSLIQNKDIHISDLVRDNFMISNKTFENCNLYGPAVITFVNNVWMNDSSFMAAVPDPNNDFFMETSSENLLGVIVFDNCIFRNCKLYKIGIIGNHENIMRARKAFNKN